MISKIDKNHNFFFLVSLSFIFQSSDTLIYDVGTINVLITYFVCFFIVIAQFYIIKFSEATKLNKITFLILITFFITVNFLAMILNILTYFTVMTILYKLIFLFLIFILVFCILVVKQKFKPFSTFIIIFFISINLFNFYKTFSIVNDQYFGIGKNNSLETFESNKILSKAVFDKKPDIHIFIYDALIPNYISNKFLDIQETSYHNFLKKKDAKIYKNAFVDIPGTTSILNLLFYPDIEKFIKLKDKYQFFNGIKNSPLVNLFKFNNYKIATSSNLAKTKRGPYTDKDIGDSGLVPPSYCNMEGRIYKFRFFGICIVYDYFILDNILDKINVIKNIDILLKDNRPWLSINYINYPSHTENMAKNSVSNYKKQFLINQEIAKDVMEKTVEKIFNSKKDSIILITGDHGPLLTNYPRISFSENSDYVIHDHQIIFISTLDKNNICPGLKDNDESKIVTPISVLGNILNCLKNDLEGDLIKNDYTVFYDYHTQQKIDTNLNKYDFLYD